MCATVLLYTGTAVCARVVFRALPLFMYYSRRHSGRSHTKIMIAPRNPRTRERISFRLVLSTSGEPRVSHLLKQSAPPHAMVRGCRTRRPLHAARALNESSQNKQPFAAHDLPVNLPITQTPKIGAVKPLHAAKSKGLDVRAASASKAAGLPPAQPRHARRSGPRVVPTAPWDD